jgi:hypothetical protein
MKPTEENRKRAEILLRGTGRYGSDSVIQNPIRDWCKSQVGRLLGKPFAPTVPEAIGELVDTLMICAESPDHARRIADHFCSVTGPCPQPAEIQARAFESRKVDKQYDPECKRGCAGGWLVVVAHGQGGVEKCTCWAERPINSMPWQQGRVKETTAEYQAWIAEVGK